MDLKIIIVDDHAIFRNGIRNALQGRKGIIILDEAENGRDLLNKLIYLQPGIIILNIQMPILDGVETLKLLKIHYPKIKVLVFSMLDDKDVKVRMMELGANYYLSKGCSSDQLYNCIISLE